MLLPETAYGPVFGELLVTSRLPAIDAGSPQSADQERLQSLTLDRAFAHTRVVDGDSGVCCLAAMWLRFDFLDQSHAISQGVATAEGSFWHAIMHRREGDFSNAKYWFRKVGEHPLYEQLAAEPLCETEVWDPYDFVDQCQSVLRTAGADTQHCQRLQQLEWELLFDYCYTQAIAP